MRPTVTTESVNGKKKALRSSVREREAPVRAASASTSGTGEDRQRAGHGVEGRVPEAHVEARVVEEPLIVRRGRRRRRLCPAEAGVGEGQPAARRAAGRRGTRRTGGGRGRGRARASAAPSRRRAARRRRTATGAAPRIASGPAAAAERPDDGPGHGSPGASEASGRQRVDLLAPGPPWPPGPAAARCTCSRSPGA